MAIAMATEKYLETHILPCCVEPNNQSDCSFALSVCVCIFESTYAGEFTHYSKNFQVS